MVVLRNHHASEQARKGVFHPIATVHPELSVATVDPTPFGQLRYRPARQIRFQALRHFWGIARGQVAACDTTGVRAHPDGTIPGPERSSSRCRSTAAASRSIVA